jgi:hypothetical protein
LKVPFRNGNFKEKLYKRNRDFTRTFHWDPRAF